MATPKKQVRLDEDNSEEGFIHSVSPTKESAQHVKYFNAIFQQENEFNNVVCFKTQLHSEMLNMQASKTPVKLLNTDKIPSKSKPGKFDIRLGRFSKVAPSKQVQFRFEDPPQNALKLIKEINEETDFNKVTIEGKVFKLGEVSTKIKNGRHLNMKDIQIADTSSSIRLTLWEDQIEKIATNKSYKFVSLTVRTWDSEKFLSTSVDTVIKEIADMSNVDESSTIDLAKTSLKEIIIISTCCKTLMQCAVCYAEINTINMEVKTYKCPNCNMRQNVSKIMNCRRCEILAEVDNNRKKLIIPEKTIKESSVTNTLASCDEIEDTLLAEEIFFAEISGNYILTLQSFLTTDSDSVDQSFN